MSLENRAANAVVKIARRLPRRNGHGESDYSMRKEDGGNPLKHVLVITENDPLLLNDNRTASVTRTLIETIVANTPSPDVVSFNFPAASREQVAQLVHTVGQSSERDSMQIVFDEDESAFETYKGRIVTRGDKAIDKKLYVKFGFDGRTHLVRAIQRAVLMYGDDVNEQSITHSHDIVDLPDPDIAFYTGQPDKYTLRFQNANLLWQQGYYTEFFNSTAPYIEQTGADLSKALREFETSRERKFGKTPTKVG